MPKANLVTNLCLSWKRLSAQLVAHENPSHSDTSGALKYFSRILLVILMFSFASAAIAAEALRVGYYGGTFGPVTLGHALLVQRAIEAAHLDIMYVMPSITNSNKPDTLPYEERKRMVQLAFAGASQVRVVDAEMEQAFLKERASGVLHVLLRRHAGAKILRLTGDDVISRNFTSHLNEDPALINVGFIIGQRSGPNQAMAEDLSQFDFGNRELILLPVQNDQGISSSQVRAMLQKDLPPSEIPLHPDVYKYIRSQKLYETPKKCGTLFLNAG